LEGPAASGNILVVDDNIAVKNFTGDALQSQGYAVTCASNSDEAVAAVRSQHFDLLVIDFMMENSQSGADEVTGTSAIAMHANGAEVARQLKQMQPDLRIMLMSGHADTAAIAMALGEVRFLPKPFDVEQLRQVVAEVLSA
jgi:CheY-like chemotaxis protein